MMKIRILLIGIFALYSLSSCEKGANLSPKLSHFVKSEHLKKLDDNESLPVAYLQYLQSEQKISRKIAESSNLDLDFSSDKNPKFPLSYFLIPDEMAQFQSEETKDPKILDQLVLSISGKRHYKFLIHPAEESQFEFLRSVYIYIGPDQTEFFASPTSLYYTLVVWNRNNSNRKPFVAVLGQNQKGSDKNLSTQIIREIPKDLLHEKN